LAKSRETAFQLLLYNHLLQQALLATYPTATGGEDCHFCEN